MVSPIIYIVGLVLIILYFAKKQVKDITSWFKPQVDIPKNLQNVVTTTPKKGVTGRTQVSKPSKYVDMSTITNVVSHQGRNYLNQNPDTRNVGGALKTIRRT